MKCDLGDLTIFYETRGTGRPIVMLPGRPSDHHSMERFMEPLFVRRDGWLRIYPDLPGTGLSPSADRLATHDAMLDAMLAFIDTVIPSQRFVLAGYSYGGYLAGGVVSRRTALIDGLMLCTPQVKADPTQAHLPKKTTLVEDPQLQAELGPVADVIVVQSPTVVEAVRQVLAEVQLADPSHQARLEAAGPSVFEVAPQSPLMAPPSLSPRDRTRLLDTAPPGICWRTTPERRSRCWIGPAILCLSNRRHFATPSCASGWIGWKNGSPLSTAHGSGDLPCGERGCAWKPR